MYKIIKYISIDILRNKVIIAYTLTLLLISLSVFNLEDTVEKGLLSLLNVVLILVPLISLIFSTVYMYNSTEFIELLVCQPIRRARIWQSFLSGLSVSMMMAFIVGIGIPVIIYAPGATGITLILSGLALTLVFVSLSVLGAVIVRDKARGVGTAIMIWLVFAIVFDALVLFLLFQFSDYPLEPLMIGLGTLNPIDLCRILFLLKMDVSALMGYTGAVFRSWFDTVPGMFISATALMLWAIIPAWISTRKFIRKDL
ncbi:MAG: hypothetical protein RL220_1582 [Bacteroidota bacterium]|jgi:Cu-processing system permease protein